MEAILIFALGTIVSFVTLSIWRWMKETEACYLCGKRYRKPVWRHHPDNECRAPRIGRWPRGEG